MHDELNALRCAYGESGSEHLRLGAEAEAEAVELAALKAALDALPPQRPAPALVEAVVAAGAAAAEPVRAVYGEEPHAPATPEAEAEASRLAPVRAALDALPPQRPAPALVEAVVAAAGAAVLGPVRLVYGEEPPALATPEAEAEAAALAEVKTALDALPPQRPAPALVEAVAAAAAPARSPRRAAGAVAADRAAASSKRRGVRRGAVAALGAAFALVLAFGVGLWPGGEAPLPVAEDWPGAWSDDEMVAKGQEAGRAAETLADAAPVEVPSDEVAGAAASAAPQTVRTRRPAPAGSAPAPVAGFSAAAERRVMGTAPVAADAGLASALAPGAERAPELEAEPLPLADGDAELQVLYLRLQEMQAAQAGIEWDAAPVSLGAEPGAAPAARAGWMQVRVER